MCHTSTSTEAQLPDTLHTVTLQIRVFIPLLRNTCSRNRIAHHFKLCSLHNPLASHPKKLLYLIRHQAVQWEHSPNVWALQVPQVSQDGHVTQDAAVHSPGRTVQCQVRCLVLFSPQTSQSTQHPTYASPACPARGNSGWIYSSLCCGADMSSPSGYFQLSMLSAPSCLHLGCCLPLVCSPALKQTCSGVRGGMAFQSQMSI